MFAQRLTTAVCLALIFLCISTVTTAATTNKQPLNQEFTELQEYAIFANAAYQSEAKIRNTIAPFGYTITEYGNIPGVEVVYFVATNNKKKTHIISVRGTSNVENAIIDFALQLVFDPHAQVYLHKGFALTATDTYKKIRLKLNKNYQVRTTGHSLGGAVATILAMYLYGESYQVERTVTFGQPKVTNVGGASFYNHLNITRVVTASDLIPLIPPMDPTDIKNLDIYWHLGQELILYPDSKFSRLAGLSSMLRATSFLTNQLKQNFSYNHKMALYLQLVKQLQKGAIFVPFKNEFGILDLVEGW